jgi:thiamine pyrophosphokinase
MHYLIWLNGSPPSEELALSAAGTADSVVVVDGAAHQAKALSINADIVCGDFDSISKTTAASWWPNAEIVELGDQNFTDFEKALKLIADRGAADCTILGLFGGRIDHQLANCAVISEAPAALKVTILDDYTTCSVISEGAVHKIKTSPSDIISLVTFDQDVEVSLSGVQWELNHRLLKPSGYGISNRATGGTVTCTVHKGGKVFLTHSSESTLLNKN